MNTIDFKHPECLKNEVLLKNMSVENFEKLGFSTIRIGKQSYDGIGNKLNSLNWFPVFINTEELQSNGLTLMEIRKKLVN